MRSLIGFLAALGLALFIAALTIRPPSPVSDDAPVTAFSAERAMLDVRQIGQVAHPTGTPENDQVRETLLRRMQQLGLEVSTQRSDAVFTRRPDFVAGGQIENLIGVLPGDNPAAPAVVLMSHYDSAVGSPGAADDAAGVAASLEALRVLLAENTPRHRDLIVLITDGEEQGLLGAEAFFNRHPLRERVGAVVNLETRGAAGRAFMFETGPNNGAMMNLYARNVREPSTTSLAAFLYSILPNDTDFSHSRDQNIAGFNIAFIGEPFHYHSATATPNALDQGSLQHLGSQALDLTRALLAAEDLPEPRPNAVFSDIFGLFTLTYPAWVGWALVALSGIGLLGLFVRSQARAETVRVAAVGALGGLLIAAVCGGLGLGLLWLTGSPTDFIMNRPLLGRLDVFELAMICACVGAILLVSRYLLRGHSGLYRPHEAPALGLLSLGWVMSVGLQILAPEAAIIATWPTLIGTVALLTARRLGDLAWPIATALGIIGSAWVIGVNHGVFLGVGATIPSAPAALTLLAILPLAALLMPAVRGRATVPVCLLFIALAVVGGLWIRWAPAGTPERPVPTLALYVADTTDGQARLATLPAMRDPWTVAWLDREGTPVQTINLPALGTSSWQTVATSPVAMPRPTIEVAALDGGRHRIVASDPAARELRLTLVSDQPMSQITVMGHPVTAPAAGTPLVVRWADPGQGFAMSLVAPPGTILHWATFHDGWPDDARALPRREPDTMPFGASDSLVVTGQRAVTPPG